MNAVLFGERIGALAHENPDGDPIRLIGLDAFSERGRVRGAFLSFDPTLAAELESDALRRHLAVQGCGVPTWTFKLEDAVRADRR